MLLREAQAGVGGAGQRAEEQGGDPVVGHLGNEGDMSGQPSGVSGDRGTAGDGNCGPEVVILWEWFGDLVRMVCVNLIVIVAGDGFQVSRPPLFFKETNPQPRKHTLWQATTDFTGGQASICK